MKNITSIKLNKDFKRAYFKGKYKAHPLIVTYIIKNNNTTVRVGITTSKKIGNAVKRNRSRRVIRAAFLEVKKELNLKGGYDFIFVARNKTPFVKSTQIAKVMKKQIASILKEMG